VLELRGFRHRQPGARAGFLRPLWQPLELAEAVTHQGATMSTKLVRKRAAARFDAVPETTATDAHLALINRLIPEGFPRATAEDVHVRSALACNDQVDYYHTRFTLEALQQIVALVNDSPVGINLMRNHNEYGSDDLPIGRLFYAEMVNVDGVNWVRVWFYWERGTEDGDEMARKIALAIWREVSISWWMNSFVNSIDGKPLNDSQYPLNCPGEKTESGQVVIGVMSGIEEINELSIVSRGGQKNTSIMPARAADESDVDGLVLAIRGRVLARASRTESTHPWFAPPAPSSGLAHLYRNVEAQPESWFTSRSDSS
jgi:hypothetical protein